jgi:hypothetical protein
MVKDRVQTVLTYLINGLDSQSTSENWTQEMEIHRMTQILIG